MRETTAPPLAEVFEAERSRLHAVAYRMLGSHADADDAVQEAWLRLSRQDADRIGNLAGWLTTVVGRIALDVLRARQSRGEESYDGCLPELEGSADEGPALEDGVALADSMGVALLVVLETLGPAERLAFVLHDLFSVPFDEVGRILGRSTDATKMLGSRARRKLRAAGPAVTKGEGGPEQHRIVETFFAAARSGDFAELLRILDPDVRLTVDTPAGTVVMLGATQVASGARRSGGAQVLGRPVLVAGRPGLLSHLDDGTPLSVMTFTIVDGLVTAIEIVTDPSRIPHAN